MATILIVDDSLFMRNHLHKLLTGHGYQTLQAEDGRQAVKIFGDHRPDVVLMDITMPNLNGMDALVEIRALDSHARVIMLTAIDQQLVAARAIHMGAYDFLIKPVLPGQLLRSVQKAIK